LHSVTIASLDPKPEMKTETTRRRFLTTGSAALAAASLAPVASSAQAAAKGKRIGFIDYDLNGYHPRVFLKAMREELKERGFTLGGCHALDEEKSRPWAEKNDVAYFSDLKALDEAVDFYMILAPSNPEVHLDLCQKIFPFRKPTYVDKTFAPNVATAKRIFGLADRMGTPIQTTSALRYTNAQTHVAKAGRENVRHMTAWVAGSNFNEYVIHPVELIVSCMGHEVEGLMRRGQDPESQLLINFSDGRTGTVNVFNKTRTRYSASITTKKATDYLEVDVKQIFIDNLAAILDFFESGKLNVDRRESIAVMKILEAAKNSAALKGFVPLG
jgi:predicted dehydrogenase